ncbi:MAG TPA: phosphate acyltransferase [Bryobacteraceae bacterium]|nr:phosphate acyltransferase [Bryobacteraceae bacterium]HPU71318.1 phosphate acyltransferase [Bryobacteraceae bacterium]
MHIPESAAAFITARIERLRRLNRKARIVFPEGDDGRVLQAAARLAREEILEPILIGRPPAGAPGGVTFIDPAESPLARKYAEIYYERRRAKGITQMEAADIARHRLYFAALMTMAGDADGEVGSAVHTTAEFVRSILQCIELRPGFRRLSSAHIMAVQDQSYGHKGLFVFSDAAVIVSPTPVQLAEIAIASADTARAVLETEPLVALLSFSTKGSAKHKEVDKVVEALRYIRERAPELNVDGELQADAALVPEVGRSKAPGSTVAGCANVLIFPDLNSANIGYKLVERLGSGALLAVVLQGIVKPVSIISRGCSVEDAYNAAIITALQAGGALAATV